MASKIEAWKALGRPALEAHLALHGWHCVDYAGLELWRDGIGVYFSFDRPIESARPSARGAQFPVATTAANMADLSEPEFWGIAAYILGGPDDAAG